jgi:nitroreductase
MEIRENKELKTEGLLNVIKSRYSTRAFIPKKLEKNQIDLLFEAAKWAPSCYNEQPWRFIVGERDGIGDYEGILSSLVEFNQNWAKSAPLLIVALGSKSWSSKGTPNLWNGFDAGQAVCNLVLQAQYMGLFTHQMGGFISEALKKKFEISDDYEIYSVIAVGYQGNLSEMSEQFKEMETGERRRKELSEIVSTDKFGVPYK